MFRVVKVAAAEQHEGPWLRERGAADTGAEAGENDCRDAKLVVENVGSVFAVEIRFARAQPYGRWSPAHDDRDTGGLFVIKHIRHGVVASIGRSHSMTALNRPDPGSIPGGGILFCVRTVLRPEPGHASRQAQTSLRPRYRTHIHPIEVSANLSAQLRMREWARGVRRET